MNELQTRANAMLQEVTGQRNTALDRCVILKGEVECLKARIAELQAQIEKARPTE